MGRRTKREDKSERPDAGGGRFHLLPARLIGSEAFRTASPRAIKILLVLFSRHNGFNNGRLGLSARDLAELTDCQNHKANSKALAELIARGFIEQTSTYPRGARMAREYRLTFAPTGDRPPTNEYRGWRPGDAGSQKKRVVKIATDQRLSVATVAEETEIPVVVAATEGSKKHKNSGARTNPSVATTAAHIEGHPCKSESRVSKSRRGATAVASGRDERMLSPDVMRKRVRAHVEAFGHGSQGRLAKLAGIAPSTFSRFLHGATLNEKALIAVACRFPNAEKAEKKRRHTPV